MPPKRFLVVRDTAPDGALRGAIVAMGNFDGVHRGHQAVIAAAEERAKGLGKPAAVLTFEPHPRVFFHPQEPLFRLTDESAKLRLLASTGLDGAIVLTFDAALASLTADQFVADILVGRFGISGAVIGFNFHFGKAADSVSRSTWSRRSSSMAARSPPGRSGTRSPPDGLTTRPLGSAFPGSCLAR
jgi:riboflavin kinase/FMN adenylyltransferase